MFTNYDEDVYTRTRISGSDFELLTVDSDNQITATPLHLVTFDDLELPDVQ